VDLVLSLDGKNLPLVGKAVACAGVPAVVIPGRGSLMENIRIAQTMGIKVIADPVLNPPLQGLSTSLTDYLVFKLTYPGMPLFFGAGNVTELLDADSPGANGLLAALASELGASILFTPEYSDKAKGCVRELRCAAEMMALAKERRTPPKDLGVDLLILKEKRRRPAEPEISCQEPEKDHPYRMDPAGSFRIGLSGGRILVQGEKICLAGTSAKDLLNTLISRGAVTLLDHAGYLGRELAKAELALLLNRSYSQDDRF
jgi:dihydropteroate synthase-like protein